MNFTHALKLSRKKIGITQKELASRCEISHEYMCKIENGKQIPNIPMIQRIARELNIPASLLTLLAVSETEVKEEKRELFKKVQRLTEGLIQVLYAEDRMNAPKEDAALQEFIGILLNSEEMKKIKGGLKRKKRRPTFSEELHG